MPSKLELTAEQMTSRMASELQRFTDVMDKAKVKYKLGSRITKLKNLWIRHKKGKIIGLGFKKNEKLIYDSSMSNAKCANYDDHILQLGIIDKILSKFPIKEFIAPTFELYEELKTTTITMNEKYDSWITITISVLDTNLNIEFHHSGLEFKNAYVSNKMKYNFDLRKPRSLSKAADVLNKEHKRMTDISNFINNFEV